MIKMCKDHLGNTYSSIKEMCVHYGVPFKLYSGRIRQGWTIEQALTKSTKDTYCQDHQGCSFTDIKAMCAHYGINRITYAKRRKMGWSLKDALTIPCNSIVYDHVGKGYDSLKDMCKAYKIPYATYINRVSRLGWDIEKALTTQIGECRPDRIPCIDHYGNEFSSIIEMCKKYNVSYNRYSRRIGIGWSIEEALTIPRNMYIGEYRVAECLKRLNVKFYHDCTIKTIFTDLNISVDWHDYLTKLQTNLGVVGYKWSKQKIQRLRPDFVLYTDEDNRVRGVIEFDGEQHQNFVEFFFKTIEEFLNYSNADFVKQSFWEYMNIPMLRIRDDQVDMIDDMVKDFISNPQNYIHNHNTYLSENEYWSILSEQKKQIDLAFAS